ncbi:MAG: hypothetical protein M3R00_06145 [Pseudomonadota bacterium]|nr:hypothetical protein [Pseudomonadota bacterium]
MKADVNEVLCVKFAADLIEMISRYKENKRHNARMTEAAFNPENIQYFIPSSVLKNFFKLCRQPIQIYIPLSVGQYYHVAAHASAQIACLENLRESFEHWFRQQMPSELSNSEDPLNLKFTWSVDLVAADCLQTLNEYVAVELDVTKSSGQCIDLLLNKDLMAREKHYYQKGIEIANFYREMFEHNKTQRKKGLNVRFKVNNNTIHWTELKNHYEDPEFREMVDYLEYCFKFGVKRIFETQDEHLPKDISKMKSRGLFKNWQEKVKLNDISYVIAEIVMVHSAILKRNIRLGELIHNFILYPGPLDVLLGSGKNILSATYSHYLSAQPCTFLRCIQYNNDGEKPDPDSLLFLGVLTKDGTRSASNEKLQVNRYKFINDTQGKDGQQQAKLLFFSQHANEMNKLGERKRLKFASSRYCHFLDSFDDECSRFISVIDNLIDLEKFSWKSDMPILCIIEFCAYYSNSFTAENNYAFIECVQNLYDKLKELQSHYARKPANRAKYLKRCGCNLVACIIAIQNHYGTIHPKQKRTKSLSSQGTQSNNSSQLHEEVAAEAIMITINNPNINFIAGLCYFLQQMLESKKVQMSALKDPDFYPDQNPQVEYRSTQESLSASAAELNNSSPPK